MDFAEIKIQHLPAWVTVFQEQGYTNASDMLDELTLIDDLLILMKHQSLLTKKRNLKQQLIARIGTELGHKSPNLNATRG